MKDNTEIRHTVDLKRTAGVLELQNAALPAEKLAKVKVVYNAESGSIDFRLPPLGEDEYSLGFDCYVPTDRPRSFRRFSAKVAIKLSCRGCAGPKDFIQVRREDGEVLATVFPLDDTGEYVVDLPNRRLGDRIVVRLLAQDAAGARPEALACALSGMEVRITDATKPFVRRLLLFARAPRLGRRALGKARHLAVELGRKLGAVLYPPAMAVYTRNWWRHLSGSDGLAIRTRLEEFLPSAPPPRTTRPIRIFQGLYATVQPTFLKRAWQAMGVESSYETFDLNPDYLPPDVYHSFVHHPDVYREHVAFRNGTLLPARYPFVDDYTLDCLWGLLVDKWGKYDVFHFGWFLSLLPDNADVEYLRRSGRPVYFHFRGCFILSMRLMAQFSKRGQSIVDACAFCKRVGWRDQYFARFSRAIDHASRVFVSTPNLCHCSKDFEYVPLSLESKLQTLPPKEGSGDDAEPVRVVHAVGGSGHYAVKGTHHIRRAVKTLKAEGLNVELDIIEGLPRHRAVEALAAGDVLVEQLSLGAYGNVAVEGMAHGLPVISSLHPTVAHLIPGCPIVHADPTTVVDRLRELVTDADLRRQLGRRCYHFVRQFHSNEAVANHLMRIYEADLGIGPAAAKNTIENMSPSYDR